MELDELLDDGEAQAEAAVHARRRGVLLPEALEHVREKIGPDADAGVRHADLDVGVDALEPDLHPPAAGRELDGVRQQVPDDLLQAVRIAGDRPGRGIEPLVDADALRLRRRPHRLDRRLDERERVDRLDVEPHLARRDAVHVEQVLDQLRLDARVALDRLEPALQLAVGGRARAGAPATSRRSR